MAPVATTANPCDIISPLKVPFRASTSFHPPDTLIELLSDAAVRYSSQELSFISSSSRYAISRTITYSSFNRTVRNVARALLELGKPSGSVILVYLTEHEESMIAIWACIIAGYIPCLQPALSAQKSHREAHVSHITNVTGSIAWLTSETCVDQLRSIPGLEIYLLSKVRIVAKGYSVATDWVARAARPDDEAIFFLTSGSSGFSKVVVHTHQTILAACSSKGIAYGLTSDSRIMNWVGFDHVAGSLEMHIAPMLFGAMQVHVHASIVLSDPLCFIRLIEENSISLTFAPNFLLAKLYQDLEKRTDLFGTFNLSSIKRINSGGEAVVSVTAKAFIAAVKKLARNPSHVSLVISPGFGMTETCAGCTCNPTDVSLAESELEFLKLGTPISGCEMRIVSVTDGVTVLAESESGELQIRGPMVFTRYYNNAQATESSFVNGGWYRTGDIGAIENGSLKLTGRIKDTIIVHGVSYGIPELEAHLQTVEGVTYSFLSAAPYRDPGKHTESFIIFYSPNFNLYEKGNVETLAKTHRALRDVSVKMITLPPQLIIPIPLNQMEKTTLGKLSRARLMSRFERGELSSYISHAEELLREACRPSFVAPANETEIALAHIYANILCMDVASVSAMDNFFEHGGTSIDVIRLKREVEFTFDIVIPTIQILKHPVICTLASYIDALKLKSVKLADYDPIVPLNTTGSKTPIFMVHPGVGEVLIFVNLAKYFQHDRPFYALRARGFEASQTSFTSMDEMVSSYLSAIKRTQSHGPYIISGYSYGGVVAFEIAKHLELMGDQVKFVGLINIPPRIADRMYEIDWTSGMLNLSYFLGLVSKSDAIELTQVLQPLLRLEQVNVVWKMSPPERLAELQLTQEAFINWVDVAGSLIECGKQFHPTGSVCGADVFYAIPLRGSKGDWLNKQLKQWSTFSRSEPVYTEVPGEHYTLMNLENIAEFQYIFRSRIEARGA